MYGNRRINIKRVYAGKYPDGTDLPGSGALCDEYHISAYTAFNVMETLERLKLVKKGNGRRSDVITRGEASTKVMFADAGPTPVAGAMAFLGAVHILSLLSPGGAELKYIYRFNTPGVFTAWSYIVY